MHPVRPAFTLIELIMVVSIVSVIAGTVFVGIDPARRLQAARNATRWADVTTLLEATKRYQFDHDGALPPVDTDARTVQLAGEGGMDCRRATCPGEALPDADCFLPLAKALRPYLKELPEDPKTGSWEDTRYYVNRDEYGIVSIGACDEEGEGPRGKGQIPEIEISR
jgi:prepilin-type N-terminal cleavage/methylation domain-containing protein